MKNYIVIVLTVLIFLLLNSNSYSQKTDTIKKTTFTENSYRQDDATIKSFQPSVSMDDDFSPGLLFIFMIFIGVMAICLVAGCVITVVLLLILVGLITAGILSASILVGIYQKSIEKGFQTFVVLFSSTAGCCLSIIAFFIINKLLHWYSTSTVIVSGATFGFVVGCCFGVLALWIIKTLTVYFKRQFNLT